jgi:hypothetical protein
VHQLPCEHPGRPGVDNFMDPQSRSSGNRVSAGASGYEVLWPPASPASIVSANLRSQLPSPPTGGSDIREGASPFLIFVLVDDAPLPERIDEQKPLLRFITLRELEMLSHPLSRAFLHPVTPVVRTHHI